MSQIIEIVDADYYSRPNSHVVMKEGFFIEVEHKIYKRLPYTKRRIEILTDTGELTGYDSRFSAWLVHTGKADWADVETFQE